MDRFKDLTEELQKTMGIFKQEDSYIEIRILKTRKGTISGYFNNIEKMLSAIKKYDGVYNVFFTLNEPANGLESRSINRLTEYAQSTTTDAEITRRRWILVDLDPVRPSGISSSNEELEKAHELSSEIREYLSEAGFPEPVTALSGNGYHILYPVDLPNDKESLQLIKDFLKMLDNKFSNERVKVDTANFNAARITKLYGTVACKGDSTDERPHRRSRIISIPDKIVEVSTGLISALVQENQSEKKDKPKRNRGRSSISPGEKGNKDFSLDKWLKKHGIAVSRTKAVDNGTCYVLAECPWNHEHSRDQGAYIIQYDNGTIIAGCHHDSCREQGVSWESLWRMMEGNTPAPDMQGDKKSNKKDSQKESQADVLLGILEESGHECFRNQKGEAFVLVREGGNPVCYSLKSEIYQELLTGIYYKKIQKSIRRESVKQVIDTLVAKASVYGKTYETFKRFTMYKEKLYYFLADAENTVLCVSENGIAPCKEPPVRLIKSRLMLEQPMPLKGKDFFEMMRKHYSLARVVSNSL
ncbi:MAG: hypothetical protein K2L07_06995 [Lachnospiraceae bacterium]|nr:hypothetical protein [Lachnospiraceae bacterium]